MRTAAGRDSSYQVDEENPYWISFSDIMAGLLVIFILAAFALILELMQKSAQWDEAISEIAKAEQVRKDMLREIERALNEQNIPVKISDNDTVLRIPENVLTFRQGSHELPSDRESRDVALQIGRVLYDSIKKDERWKYLDTIFIEGHTDSVPYGNRAIKGNWGLSTFRAISIWDYWNASLPEGSRLEEMNNHIGKKLFSVSGYAATRPDPATEANLFDESSLRKNRRIDIRFTVRRPALEEYERVKEGNQ
jgi:flagellar motor protein MotB